MMKITAIPMMPIIRLPRSMLSVPRIAERR
jgi:hypothetical protein